MSFAERVERQQEAVFRTLGEDAQWQGVGIVRVIRREADERQSWGDGTALLTGRVIRVRRVEVPEPGEGETVQILDAAGNPVANGLYAVAGEPELDRKGVWHCQVRPAS